MVVSNWFRLCDPESELFLFVSNHIHSTVCAREPFPNEYRFINIIFVCHLVRLHQRRVLCVGHSTHCALRWPEYSLFILIVNSSQRQRTLTHSLTHKTFLFNYYIDDDRTLRNDYYFIDRCTNTCEWNVSPTTEKENFSLANGANCAEHKM